MKNYFNFFAFFFMLCFFYACGEDTSLEAWQVEVVSVRQAAADFKKYDDAISMGWDTDVSGYVSQMGHHYLNGGLVDNTFEAEKPEVILFAPDVDGNMVMVAVEYVVPIEDLENPPPAPEGFDGEKDVWQINPNTSLWTLHLWIGLENPEGIFDPTNPLLD